MWGGGGLKRQVSPMKTELLWQQISQYAIFEEEARDQPIGWNRTSDTIKKRAPSHIEKKNCTIKSHIKYISSQQEKQ